MKWRLKKIEKHVYALGNSLVFIENNFCQAWLKLSADEHPYNRIHIKVCCLKLKLGLELELSYC
jgi:hypothetical protein